MANEPSPVASPGRPVEQAQPIPDHIGTDALEIAEPAAARAPNRVRHLAGPRRAQPRDRLAGINRNRMDDGVHDRRLRSWGAEQPERIMSPASGGGEFEDTTPAGRHRKAVRLRGTRPRCGQSNQFRRRGRQPKVLVRLNRSGPSNLPAIVGRREAQARRGRATPSPVGHRKEDRHGRSDLDRGRVGVCVDFDDLERRVRPSMGEPGRRHQRNTDDHGQGDECEGAGHGSRGDHKPERQRRRISPDRGARAAIVPSVVS